MHAEPALLPPGDTSRAPAGRSARSRRSGARAGPSLAPTLAGVMLSAMSEVVSANEAAHRFGVSEKTVRRWIASGKLKADKSGRAYRVVLSEVGALSGYHTAQESGPIGDTVQTADIGSAPSIADSRSAMSGIPELVALVDRLQSEARQHAETAAMWQERASVWQERAGSLADRLALTESKLLALEAPASSERPGAVEPEPEPPAASIPASTPFPATIEPSQNDTPWWQRWRGWLSAHPNRQD